MAPLVLRLLNASCTSSAAISKRFFSCDGEDGEKGEWGEQERCVTKPAWPAAHTNSMATAGDGRAFRGCQ